MSMSLKRSHDSTPLANKARKRRQYSLSSPVTPAASHISFSTPLTTPHTPYPSRPSDSPGNPFGKKRTKHLTRSLPESTSFSKHLPLRFQFIRMGSACPRQGGVYRIVQVPLSYTFTHLRCLIAWLFCGLPEEHHMDGHLFEVKKGATVYSQLYKPGQVKSGQTWVKLSSSQNPYRFQSGYLNGDDDEEPEEDQLSSDVEDIRSEEGCENEELEDWKWEDEEEFTVGHAWPKGPELERAIVYHHSLTTQIHVTINQTSIPRRKGKSNTPYIFSARGRVWLSPPPLPRPIFAVPLKTVKSPGQRRQPLRRMYEKDTEPASETESETSDDETYDDIDLELDPKHWNESPNSFAKFLARYMGSAQSQSNSSSSIGAINYVQEEESFSEGDTLAYPSTPGLTRSSSAPSSPVTLLPTSSPLRASSCAPVDIASPDAEDEGGYLTLSLPALTPFPLKARPIRKRMERIERRMGKLKKGKWLCQYDDKDEESGNEKDELVDNDDGEGESAVLSKENKVERKEDKKPLDWDPFGEEEEL